MNAPEPAPVDPRDELIKLLDYELSHAQACISDLLTGFLRKDPEPVAQLLAKQRVESGGGPVLYGERVMRHMNIVRTQVRARPRIKT